MHPDSTSNVICYNCASSPSLEQATYVLLIQTVFMALLMGSIYFDIGLSQSSIQVIPPLCSR